MGIDLSKLLALAKAFGVWALGAWNEFPHQKRMVSSRGEHRHWERRRPRLLGFAARPEFSDVCRVHGRRGRLRSQLFVVIAELMGKVFLPL